MLKTYHLTDIVIPRKEGKREREPGTPHEASGQSYANAVCEVEIDTTYSPAGFEHTELRLNSLHVTRVGFWHDSGNDVMLDRAELRDYAEWFDQYIFDLVCDDDDYLHDIAEKGSESLGDLSDAWTRSAEAGGDCHGCKL